MEELFLMNKKQPYTLQEHIDIVSNVGNTYPNLINRGLVMPPNIYRADQSHKAVGNLQKTTNPSTFIANNTLAQSNPYRPNQAWRKK
tara:strand:+ start:219 stop:479 length:261 start_codon:yes stop_codon:yes gene_type:complete